MITDSTINLQSDIQKGMSVCFSPGICLKIRLQPFANVEIFLREILDITIYNRMWEFLCSVGRGRLKVKEKGIRKLEIRSVERGICPIAKSTMKGLFLAGCIAHARNGRISTSGLKSDVKVVFLDSDFLKDAKISAIRVHLRQI